MRKFLTLFLLVWLHQGPCLNGRDAPSLAEVAEKGRQEARQALSELRSFREEATREQLPLENEISRLRQSLEGARETLEQLRESRDSSDLALAELEREVSRLNAARQTAESLLGDLLDDWSETPAAFSHPDERETAASWSAADLPLSEKIAQARPILTRIADDLLASVGGRIEPLSVFGTDGRRVNGTGLFFGPLVYFIGDRNEVVGTVDQTDPAFPRVILAGGTEAEQIRETARTKGGFLPLDSTGGAALALRRTEPGLIGELRKGGIWIYPIVAAAAVAALVALVKWISISRIRFSLRRAEPRFREIFGKDADASGLEEILNRQPSLLRPFWKMLWEERNSDPDVREDILFTKLIEIRLRLTRGLAALSVIAATTPLLGLLGTVTGMISTFRRITLFGAGDPQALSGGISEALVTTKFGLIVAIPTFLLYAFLSRRAQGTASELERIKDTLGR